LIVRSPYSAAFDSRLLQAAKPHHQRQRQKSLTSY
jgi:hypothetical protein